MALFPVLAVYTQAEGSPLVKPRGVSVDRATGEVYVADAGANLVTIYSPGGVPITAIGMNGELQEPVRAVATPDGTIYVLNGSPRRVYLANLRGEIRGEFSFAGLSPGEMVEPVALATDGQGNLYVGTAGENPEILVYDTVGRLVRRAGRGSDGTSLFKYIGGIAVDRPGRIFALDPSSSAPVKVLDPEGRLLMAWGERGRARGAFSLPAGIALDGSGRVIVVDGLRQSIQVYTAEGQFLGIFGGFGILPGEVLYPADVDTDGESRIYVTEREGRRLQAYREGAAPSSSKGPGPADGTAEEARARVRAEIQRQNQLIGRSTLR